ncbi:MAG: AraC family transcriptional regulator [bacterium]|nr:AraC family transcriptional regulator [bacterium]
MSNRILTRAQTFRQLEYPLDVQRIQRHTSTVLHSHDFSELVVVLGGRGVHVTPAGQYDIGAGDVFILHEGQDHGYLNTENLELVNILFNMDEMNLPPMDITSLSGYHVLFTLEPKYRRRDRFESRLRLSRENLRLIAGLINHLEAEFLRHDPGWRFAAIAYFMLIVADLSRFYSHVEEPVVQPLLRLGRVIGHLERNYADPTTLDDLARVGCMSRRTLTRVFKHAMGCSPIEYLIRLRVNHAAELLLASGGPQDVANVTEIAFQVGFQDSNYFTRQFRRLIGTNPRDYKIAIAPARRQG